MRVQSQSPTRQVKHYLSMYQTDVNCCDESSKLASQELALSPEN